MDELDKITPKSENTTEQPSPDIPETSDAEANNAEAADTDVTNIEAGSAEVGNEQQSVAETNDSQPSDMQARGESVADENFNGNIDGAKQTAQNSGANEQAANGQDINDRNVNGQGANGQGCPDGSAPYGQYTPPRQQYGVPPYGQGYGAPYGHYYNRPYNGYYHTSPVPPPYGYGQGQQYGGQNGPQQGGQGYGHVPPYGQHPAGPYSANPANHPSASSGKKPPKKRMSKGLVVFICIACCVAVGVIGLSIGIVAGKALGKIDINEPSFSVIEGGDEAGSPSDFDLNTEGATDRTMTYEQVISSVSDSVVSITVYSSSGSAGAIASGIIMDKDGYILTNDHIYSEVPNASFLITLNSGTEFKASFVSGDKKSDLAILKIDNPSGLSPATFATESVKTGQEVLAIGASAGLDGSVTQGIVSAVDRRVSNGTSSEKFIQTTAAINPGTSGGALVNMSGQVVGICSSKYASTDIDNVCFAIPTTRALGVIDQLKAYGKVTNRARLGITYTYINTVAAELKGVPTGLLVKSIDRDSTLKNSGIKENDIITQVDDTDIVSADQVLDIVEKAQIGDQVKLTVYSSETGAYFTVNGTYIQSESQSSYTTEDNTTSYNTQNPYDFFGDYGK